MVSSHDILDLFLNELGRQKELNAIFISWLWDQDVFTKFKDKNDIWPTIQDHQNN